MRNVVIGSALGFVIGAAFLAACGGGGVIPATTVDELAQQLTAISNAVQDMEGRLDQLDPPGERFVFIPHTAFHPAQAVSVYGDSTVRFWLGYVEAAPSYTMSVISAVHLPRKALITRVELRYTATEEGDVTLRLRAEDSDFVSGYEIVPAWESGPPPNGPTVAEIALETPFNYDPTEDEWLAVHAAVKYGSKLSWVKVYYTTVTE